MLRFLFFVLLISFSKLTISIAQDTLKLLQPKVVYGTDDRREFYEIKNKKVKNLSSSSVALFDMFSLNPINNAETLFEIDANTLKQSYSLCSTEKYLTQPIGAFCSGFLIAPDIIVSAGHCVTSQFDCENMQFVFDYKYTTKQQTEIHIPSTSIYFCEKLLFQNEDRDLDYSIIKLDRKVTDRQPLKIRTKDTIKDGTSVFVVGYPSGIPLKVTQGGAKASVFKKTNFGSTTPKEVSYFLADLDTFQGNSGSAVLNSVTHEVEGILVGGEQDYKYNSKNACYKVNICKTNNTCSQEAVVKITSLKKEIEAALKTKAP